MIKPEPSAAGRGSDNPSDLASGLYWGCLFSLGIWFTAIGAGFLFYVLIRSWFT